MVRLLGRCIPIFCMPKKKRQSLPIGEAEAIEAKHHQEEINKLFVRRVESIRVTQQGAMLKRFPSPKLSGRKQQNKKTKSRATPKGGEKIVKPDDTEFDCETHISDQQMKPKAKTKTRLKSKKKLSSIKQKQPVENKNPLRYRKSLDKLFHKTAKPKVKVPSPPPSTSSLVNAADSDHNDTCSSISSSSSSSSSSSGSMSSDWSSSTYSDSNSCEQIKHSTNKNLRRQSMPITNVTNRNEEKKHKSCVGNFCAGKERTQPNTSITPARAKPTSLNSIDHRNQTRKSPSQFNRRAEIKPSAKSKQVLQNVRKMIKDQSVQEQHFNDTRQRESVRL